MLWQNILKSMHKRATQKFMEIAHYEEIYMDFKMFHNKQFSFHELLDVPLYVCPSSIYPLPSINHT